MVSIGGTDGGGERGGVGVDAGLADSDLGSDGGGSRMDSRCRADSEGEGGISFGSGTMLDSN